MIMYQYICVLLTLTACPGIQANKRNLVLTPEDDDGPRALPLKGPLRPLTTNSLHINSAIKSRYGMVHVTRTLTNPEDTAQQVIFLVTLPETAFISNFSMTIKGVTYVGKVKEKELARKIYNESVSKGQSAGHIEAQDQEVRFSNKFDVAVNVGPREKITFQLTYEELLERKKGKYEHVININAGEIIEDLRVDVFIKENQDFKFIKVPRIRTNVITNDNEEDNSLVKIDQRGQNSVYISYNPNKREQTSVSDKGVNGQFVVQYDLKRSNEGGDLQVEKDYFVHFFAPELQIQMKKHVVFVIDTSGSMDGIKIKQTKEALYYIFDKLQEDDLFTIIEFDTIVKVWNGESSTSTTSRPSVITASKSNVNAAKNFITSLTADGSTNINDALLLGLKATHETHNDDDLVTMVVFLTDGQPTAGVTSLPAILENIKTKNLEMRVPLFSLAFGVSANFGFLKKLSFQNYGTARKIYEAEDADNQLKDFFQEISSPLLSDIKIKFKSDSVVQGSVPKAKFGAFFKGSEFVVSGKLTHPDVEDFDVKVSAKSSNGLVNMVVKPVKVESGSFEGKYVNFLERLWAYLNIQELLAKSYSTENSTQAEALKKEALELSLKYNFVTQVTSMVVVQPNKDSVSGLQAGDAFGGSEDRKTYYNSYNPTSGSSSKLMATVYCYIIVFLQLLLSNWKMN